MSAIKQNQMDILIDHFCKVWIQLPTIEDRNLVLADLNDAMRDLFDNAKCNGYMFGIGKHDCHIVADMFTKKIKVQYHRRFKPRYKPNNSNPWELVYSHEIKFSKFCYENCNPTIIHIIERILFQRI